MKISRERRHTVAKKTGTYIVATPQKKDERVTVIHGLSHEVNMTTAQIKRMTVTLKEGALFGITKRITKKQLPYMEAFQSPLGMRAQLVKKGVSPGVIPVLARDMNYDQGELVSLLGVPRATFQRKLRDQKPLDLSASERVLGVMRIVGQVQQMVEESGVSEGFDASAWVGHWLEQPLPALGGKAPAEFMDTAPGQELISQLLAQTQSGAYA